MGKQISNTVLMTGAGYTKNYGGLLADQMWAKIFNHKEVQDKPALKDLLLDTFDYESVYHEVCNDDYTDSEKKTYTVDEKEAIRTAILKAYETLDVIAQNYIPVRDDSKLNILNGARKVIYCLTRDMSQINFFFTVLAMRITRTSAFEKWHVSIGLLILGCILYIFNIILIRFFIKARAPEFANNEDWDSTAGTGIMPKR